MIDRAFLQPVTAPVKNISKPVNPLDVAEYISASSNAAGPSDMSLPPEMNTMAFADAPPEYEYPLPADTWETGAMQLDEHVAPAFIELSEAQARAKPNNDSECLKVRAVEAEREVRVLEELVLAGMRRLANIHPNPLVQAKWDARAEELSKHIRSSNAAPPADANAFLIESETIVFDSLESFQRTGRRLLERRDGTHRNSDESILTGLGKSFLIVFGAPFILAGATVFAMDAILYGTGKVVLGLGHLLSSGKFHSHS